MSLAPRLHGEGSRDSVSERRSFDKGMLGRNKAEGISFHKLAQKGKSYLLEFGMETATMVESSIMKSRYLIKTKYFYSQFYIIIICRSTTITT